MTPTARLDVDAVVRRAAVGLAAVAFAGSYLHVATFAAAKGQHLVLALVIAAMPEVSVAVCILRPRPGRTLRQRAWAGALLAPRAASPASELDAPFPVGRGGEAEQVAWFRPALQSFPSRTDKRWADLTGLSERTVQRRIDAAGGRPRGAQLGAPRLVEVGAA